MRAVMVNKMSAKSLEHRWKHEVQIALLRQRAAMTRAVHPHTSASAEWLLAGPIYRVASHRNLENREVRTGRTLWLTARRWVIDEHDSCTLEEGCLIAF